VATLFPYTTLFRSYQRNTPLISQLNKVCAFEGGLRKQNTVVRYDADPMSIDARKSGHKGRTVILFKLMKRVSIDHAQNDLAYVKRGVLIGWNNAVDLAWITSRF